MNGPLMVVETDALSALGNDSYKYSEVYIGIVRNEGCGVMNTEIRCEKRGCYNCILSTDMPLGMERTMLRCPYMIHNYTSFRRIGKK